MGNFDFFEQLLGVFAIIALIFIAYLVVLIIANWKLLKKAGKGGWEALIPFYNSFVLAEVAGLNWWWFLLMIASSIFTDEESSLTGIAFLVTLFGSFNCYYNIARKFGKTKNQAILAGIFSFVYVFIFAFSKNEVYNSNIAVSKNGILGSDEVTNNNFQNNNNSVQQEFVFCGSCGTKLRKDAKFCQNCGKSNQ